MERLERLKQRKEAIEIDKKLFSIGCDCILDEVKNEIHELLTTKLPFDDTTSR